MYLLYSTPNKKLDLSAYYSQLCVNLQLKYPSLGYLKLCLLIMACFQVLICQEPLRHYNPMYTLIRWRRELLCAFPRIKS